jgi:UDP-2-acetamido-2-deoxy-ribo-hexuluronate aminotransferase
LNFLLDINVVLDNFDKGRREKFPSSVEVFEYLKTQNNTFISSCSIDNIEFLKTKDLRIEKGYSANQAKKIVRYAIKDLLQNFKIAKTPSYIEIDYEDIEDSQIVASAKAVNAKIITRDEKLLQKYPDITISPLKFLSLSLNTVTSIDFANLKKQYFRYNSELEKSLDDVLNNANFIMGPEVNSLEEELCAFTGAKHSISCSSGTDALLLAMMALNIGSGDEVITTPFTFIATAETIAFLGAKPVFVDIDEKTYNIDPSKIEEVITEKTKAIIPVSLYGQPSDMDEINSIAIKYNLFVIEDAAQSFGATYKGKRSCNLSYIGCTSFFPAKPLGCFGDGGAVFTNDDELAQRLKSLRIHGQTKRYHHKYIGMGGRLDALQAAVLRVKLKHYPEDLKKRQEVAKKYTNQLNTQDSTFSTPEIKEDRTSAWAQYSIRVKNRDKLQAKLKESGIPTAVHYPKPLHLQECFAYLGYKEGDFPICEKISKEIMSLPMNPDLSYDEIEYICRKLYD